MKVLYTTLYFPLVSTQFPALFTPQFSSLYIPQPSSLLSTLFSTLFSFLFTPLFSPLYLFPSSPTPSLPHVRCSCSVFAAAAAAFVAFCCLQLPPICLCCCWLLSIQGIYNTHTYYIEYIKYFFNIAFHFYTLYCCGWLVVHCRWRCHLRSV